MTPAEITLKNTLTVIRDPLLGYRHLYPLPDPQTVTRYYGAEDGFYRDGAAWLRKEQREHRQGLWQPAYRWQAGLLLQTRLCSRLVDLGTGAGWFVDYWNREQGPAVGVEPSRSILQFCPCPSRIESNLSLAYHRFRPETPVYLRASLLLEHLPDPVGYLRDALDWFPGCVACMIVVPNDFSPLQLKLNDRLAGDKRYWWIAKDHLNYFDREGLRAVMVAAGLQIVFEGATCPLELFALYGGLNYIGRDGLGRFVHRTRLAFERLLGPLAFGLYQRLYRRYGWGRELVFIGVPDDH